MTERFGTVVDTTVDSFEGAVYVDVSLGPRNTRHGMKFQQPASVVWVVPNVGDTVKVTQTQTGELVAQQANSTNKESFPDDISEGDFKIQKDENTYIWFRENADGTTDIVLETDGDVIANGTTL